MKQRVRNEKIIKHFATLLECDELIVTGSHALSLLGMTDQIPNDLDIILINPTDESINILKRLQEAGPYESVSKPYPSSKELYRIQHDNIKVDFFVECADNTQSIELDGYSISTVGSIVKAKRGYNRLKDWFQLRRMARGICDEVLFQKFIDGQ